MTDKISHTEIVSLKLIGINDIERVKLESILAIAEPRLDIPWQIVEGEKIDFYLISHRLRSQMDQKPILSSLPRNKCIYYVTEETSIQENELLMTGDGLPSFRSLILLFNALSATVKVYEEQAKPSEIKSAPALKDPLASSGVFRYQKKTGSKINVSGEQLKSIESKPVSKPKDSPSSFDVFKYQKKTESKINIASEQLKSIELKPISRPKNTPAADVLQYQKKTESKINVSGDQRKSIELKTASKIKNPPVSSDHPKDQKKAKLKVNIADEQVKSVEIPLKKDLKDSLASFEVFKYQKKTESSAVPVKSGLPSSSKNTYFDPETGFVGLLLSGKTTNYRFNLEIGEKSASLYISLLEGKYYSNCKLEQLTPFFSSDVPSISDAIAETVLQSEVSTQGLKQRPLGHLIWYAVFCQSQGCVRKGYRESDIVYLKRWPDINLPGCRELIKLAAFMQSNAVELSVTQQETGFSIEQIYNFYNACHAIGLVEQTEQQDIHDKNLNNEKRALFSQIGKRLNQVKKPLSNGKKT